MSPIAGDVLCTEVVPRIRAAFPTSVKFIGAEDHSELIQDTIATAAALLHRAEAAGKQVTPGNVAYFAVKLTRSGRRSTHSSTTDVMSPGTRLAGRTQVISLDEPLGMDDEATEIPITLADVFDNGAEDPSMLAARNLDWETFYGNQTPRGRRILAVVAEGSTLRDVARFLGLSDSSIQGEKRKLALALQEFMGVNILAESTREPKWRDNTRAARERQAVRLARAM
jgi:DNA-binding NarL/FixJ family response regulator